MRADRDRSYSPYDQIRHCQVMPLDRFANFEAIPGIFDARGSARYCEKWGSVGVWSPFNAAKEEVQSD
jgi:hypothetical protein